MRIDPVYVFSWVCLSLWMVFAIFPVAWSYLNSLKPPEQIFDLPPKLVFTPTLHNYAVIFGLEVGAEAEGVSQTQAATGAASQLPRYFLNSLIVSIGTTPARHLRSNMSPAGRVARTGVVGRPAALSRSAIQ